MAFSLQTPRSAVLTGVALSLVLCAFSAVKARSQTRTVETTGTATGMGMVHIRIEDFEKPDLRRQVFVAVPSAVFNIDVSVPAGSTCQQTTNSMQGALLETLPPIYSIEPGPLPCTMVISRGESGKAPVVHWIITITEDIPGQTIEVIDGPIATIPSTWSLIKLRLRPLHVDS